jgi:hypothetical protein
MMAAFVNPTNSIGPSFDRGKPFYPLVMNYLTLLAGFKELALRGVMGKPSVDAVLSQLGAMPESPKEQLDDLRKQLSNLAGPLELRSEFSASHITIDIDEVAREIFNNSAYLATFLMRASGSLLILAYELSEKWRDDRPLWQFLRHCRHAAAHGGKVSFKGNEPKHLAQWGCLVFVRTLQGSPLFKSEDGVGMLSPGDPIRLLYDIEQAYPQMTLQ